MRTCFFLLFTVHLVYVCITGVFFLGSSSLFSCSHYALHVGLFSNWLKHSVVRLSCCSARYQRLRITPEMECKTITPHRHRQTFRSTDTLYNAQELITSAMEQVSNNRLFPNISHSHNTLYYFTFLLSQFSFTIFLHYWFLTSQLIYWHLQQEEGSYI